MKKISFFIVIMGLFICDSALAKKKCVVTTCPNDASEIGENKEFIYANSGGGGQCYSCDSNDYNNSDDECAYDAIVGQKNPVGRYVSLYRCTDVRGAEDEWHNFNPTLLCDNSPVNRATSNTETYYLTEGSTKSEPVEVGDHNMVKAGNSACVYYVCKSGFIPNADKSDCIADTRESVCVNSGGTYAGGVCSCDAGKKLKQNAGKTACECVSADYEFIAASKQCEETAASRQRRQQRQQQQQTAIKRTNCEDSGGTWAGGACSCAASKNLRLESGKCVCIDANYQWDAGSKTGKITGVAALKRACEAATGTYWTGKECKCTQANFWFDGAKCIENPDIVACRSVRGAVWNQLESKCKCADAKKVISGDQCVETEDARREREAAEQAATIVAIKSRIKTASKTLDEIRAGFDVSVWKDEEGKFNTSRLVSDSVAGVVLGTAGGLITSNVVKKNQVENGFEDIQCTVGGQVVANWGDEFRVGIQ